MKINIKQLIIFILVPLGLGAVVGLLTSGQDNYNNMIMPSFAPPAILFPIVWSILYILMGISRYLISQNGADSSTIRIYNIQLLVNLLWSFPFFIFKWYLFSFLWIILLIVVVVIMIIKFYTVSKTAALLQIPYLLWITFASILNFAIYMLN